MLLPPLVSNLTVYRVTPPPPELLRYGKLTVYIYNIIVVFAFGSFCTVYLDHYALTAFVFGVVSYSIVGAVLSVSPSARPVTV